MPDVTLPPELLQAFQDAENALAAASTGDASVAQKQQAVSTAQNDLNVSLTDANAKHTDANAKAAKLLADLKAHFGLT